MGAEFYIWRDGHKDRHDKINSRFSQCCKRVYKRHIRFCSFRDVVISVRWSCEIMELGDTSPCARNCFIRYPKYVVL